MKCVGVKYGVERDIYPSAQAKDKQRECERSNEIHWFASNDLSAIYAGF